MTTTATWSSPTWKPFPGTHGTGSQPEDAVIMARAYGATVTTACANGHGPDGLERRSRDVGTRAHSGRPGTIRTRPNDMDAPAMSPQRHERGNHAVSTRGPERRTEYQRSPEPADSARAPRARNLVTREPIRDPFADHLLTPQWIRTCWLTKSCTRPSQLQDVLPGITALDRTTINAWEDAAGHHRRRTRPA